MRSHFAKTICRRFWPLVCAVGLACGPQEVWNPADPASSDYLESQLLQCLAGLIPCFETPFAVASTSPSAGEREVALNSSIVITFTEEVDESTLSTTDSAACTGSVLLSADGFSSCIAMTSANLDVSANPIVSMTPGALLANNVQYELEITGAVKAKADGTGLSPDWQSNFYTPDTVAPTHGANSPLSGGTGIDANTSISVTFSESMDPASLNGVTLSGNTCAGPIQVSTDSLFGAGTCIAFVGEPVASSDARTFTVRPQSTLALNTTYYIRADSGPTDVVGNPFAGPVDTSFTTFVGYSVSATVSGLQSPGTALVLSNSGGTANFSANGTQVISANLPDSTSYNVTVSTAAANPYHVCTVNSGSGTISGANVTVTVTCVKALAIALTPAPVTPNLGGPLGADATCASSMPGSRALIVDGISRRACANPNCTNVGENIDWALYPDTPYRRLGDDVYLGTTNTAGIFTLSTTSLPSFGFALPPGGAPTAWTGLNADWTSSANNCQQWSTISGAFMGNEGNPNSSGTSAIFTGTGNCNLTGRVLICVEQ